MGGVFSWPLKALPRGVSESSEASFARRSRMARFILNEAPSTHFLWVTHLKHLSREFRRPAAGAVAAVHQCSAATTPP